MANERRGTVLRIPATRVDGRDAIVRVYDHPPEEIRGVAAHTEEVRIVSCGVEVSLWVRVIET
jgi:hypothetical protein